MTWLEIWRPGLPGKDEEDLYLTVNCFKALAFLPVDHVVKAYEKLIETREIEGLF